MSWTMVGAMAVAVLAGSVAAAEEGGAARRTQVAIHTGVASGASDTGFALGASVVQGLGGRAALDVRAAWLDRGRGAEALSATAALVVNLRSAREKAVPYLAVGGGLYRVSFDMGEPRFGAGMNGPYDMGPNGSGPGYGSGPHMGSGPYGPGPSGPGAPTGFGQMPMFYAGRMARRGVAGHQSFTDPAIVAGGGLRLDLGDRAFVRPDLRAIVVAADGDTHTVGLFSVDVGFGF